MKLEQQDDELSTEKWSPVFPVEAHSLWLEERGRVL
jgi:hypothetical protein